MTQCERLLSYLQEHGSCDPLTAWTELGIYRLSARIDDLRKRGHTIVTKDKQVINMFNEVCTIAKYVLIYNAPRERTAVAGTLRGVVGTGLDDK